MRLNPERLDKTAGDVNRPKSYERVKDLHSFSPYIIANPYVASRHDLRDLPNKNLALSLIASYNFIARRQ